MSKKEASARRAVEVVAMEELGIETLDERGRDHLDFHDVGVAVLRRALLRAFELGRNLAEVATA